MILDVPFYKNNKQNTRCAQVAMRAVLKYYLNKSFSLKELDSLTGRKKHYWTWGDQITSVLNKLGIKVFKYSGANPRLFLKGE